ncbi:MAG: hypothetical protein E7K04_03945 [Helicobacter sp.]|nr:hypothetical protein [Helicobacter sp.]
MRYSLILMLFFAGCVNFSKQSVLLDVVDSKLMQSSRMAHFKQDDRVIFNIIATHLNEILPKLYANNEYFLLESKSDLRGAAYELNGQKALFIREIKSFNQIIYPKNKYSRLFVVAFPKLSALDVRKILLKMRIKGADLLFDFSFKNLPDIG